MLGLRLIDDEYESSNIASQKEIGSISGNTNLNHTRYTHLSATKQTVNLVVTDTIKFKEYNRNNR